MKRVEYNGIKWNQNIIEWKIIRTGYSSIEYNRIQYNRTDQNRNVTIEQDRTNRIY